MTTAPAQTNTSHVTIIAFCGPSGSGKTELVDKLGEEYPDSTTKWNQATTRARRNKQDNYVFVSTSQYHAIASTLTCRTNFHGNFYGTFPEPGIPGQAVLTIVDIKGIIDLSNDVADHNASIAAGRSGKLGDLPVRLVRVLLDYEITQEAIDLRCQNRGRSLEFVQSERRSFEHADFEKRFDTTTSWPSAIEVFDTLVWPAIAQPFSLLDPTRVPNLLERIGVLYAELTTTADAEVIYEGLSLLADVEQLFTKAPVPVVVQDEVDAVLSADGDISVDSPVLQEEANSGTVIGHVIHNIESTYDKDTKTVSTHIDATEIKVISHVDLTVEVNKDTVTLTQTAEPGMTVEIADGAVAITAPEIAITAEPEPLMVAEVEPAVPVVENIAFTSLGAICSVEDFDDWMGREVIGLEAFSSVTNFRTIFSQYISSHGGNPNDIHVTDQLTKDGKNGTIRGFIATLANGERFNLEFNERIKQVVHSGMM